ncbi:MAG: putative bifunctional diguanylate cyclase/phosphodiesterase [Janthinobacterium lividum]
MPRTDVEPPLSISNNVERRCVDLDKLVLRWMSSRIGEDIPFYEDVALGSLGAVADRLGIAHEDGPGQFRFLRAGPEFERQIGHDMMNMACDALAPGYRIGLLDCLRRAIAQRTPAEGLARCVVDGAVATCDVLAMPLRNRWGGDLVLVYLRQRPIAQDLLAAMYRSTGDGLVALAATIAPDGSPDFQIVSLNGTAADFFGRPEDAICWKLLSDLVPSSGRNGLLAELTRAMARQEPHVFEFAIRRADVPAVHLRISVAPVGDLLGVALTDVTEMKGREDSVRLLFENNPMPLLVYQRRTMRVRSVNNAMTRLCGRSAEDLLDESWLDLFETVDRAALMAASRDPADSQEAPRSWKLSAGARGPLDVEIYANHLAFEGDDCVLASIHDVTAQRRAQAQVAYLAHHDDLTGLCNRSLFRTRLADSLAVGRDRGELLAVLCIDLDHFKQVNDTLGHGAGDRVLRMAGERIAAVIGPSGVAARLGGDEFAIIATGLSTPAEAGALAERLIARIAAPYLIEGHQAVIGASIGLSLAPGDGSDPDILLHNADIALYRSKAAGRGTLHYFEAGMDEALQARRSLEADLRQALGRGEFELYYQPIFAAETLAILGFEALLRWFHPERGAVSPAEFIPVAEEIGVIDALGAWVLRQACAEAARWPADCRVAVNLSAVQFRRADLADTVAAALAEAGLDAKRLELEITESVFLDDSTQNLAMLHRLRALGVVIALDDFGTGYSSLAYLNRFPFDKIKIDRSFIRDMAENRHGLAIIRAVVSLGNSLGIRTLAEGVETPDQLARLREEGCSELQGFHLGRPLPAPRLKALLAGPARRLEDAA